MAKVLVAYLRRSSLLRSPALSVSSAFWSSLRTKEPAFCLFGYINSFYGPKTSCQSRALSYGNVRLVISEGKPKFETYEVDPPVKEKWKTKKKLKLQRKREKEKRKAANRNDPRRLTVKRKRKQKFPNNEERLKCKIERAKIKEALLIERLKKYEVPKMHGPEVKLQALSCEERFFLKKMAQKRSNYVPVGRRGIFGGVILNMHMHWKKHETVKVYCKPCRPGQIQEYAKEIARLSGGIPIQIIGDDTIVFYRGKKYSQPEVMSPVDTLSKKRALEKSKYEQSLESVRHFIAVLEKQLELYYQHASLYDHPSNGTASSISGNATNCSQPVAEEMGMEADSAEEIKSTETEDDFEDHYLSSTTFSDTDSDNDSTDD